MPPRLPHFITDRIPSRDDVFNFVYTHRGTIVNLVKYGAFLGVGALAGWWCTRDSAPEDLRDLEEVISVDYGLDVNHNGTPDAQLRLQSDGRELVYLCDAVTAPWDSVLVAERDDDALIDRHPASRGERNVFTQAVNQRLQYTFTHLAEEIDPLSFRRQKRSLRVSASLDAENKLASLVLLNRDDAVVARFTVTQREQQGTTVRDCRLTQLVVESSEGMVRIRNETEDVIPRLSQEAQTAYQNFVGAVDAAYLAQIGRGTVRLERALEQYK